MAVDLEYYGVPPADYVQNENRTRVNLVAGQTTVPAQYNVGYVDVWYNGSKLDPFTEFTGTDGANIVLATPAGVTGDILQVISRAQVQLTNVYTQQQVNALTSVYYAVCTGTGDAQIAVTNPTFTAYSDGMTVRIRSVAANVTTTPTINCNNIGAITIVSNFGDGALFGADWGVNTELTLRYIQALNRFVLVEGAFTSQTPPALNNSNEIATTGFANSVGSAVGSVRNLAVAITAASATATVTADEIVVETALGAAPFRIGSFNKTLVLTTTGAGGMDTGSAPNSGYVGIYAIYNPSTSTAALLATNATSAAVPNIYAGANMPSGYTASALLSVWLTTSAGLLVKGYQRDRKIWCVQNQVLSLTGQTAAISGATASLATAIPKNAITVMMQGTITATTGTGGLALTIADPNSITGFSIGGAASVGDGVYGNFEEMVVVNPQSINYSTILAGVTAYSCALNVSGYTI
jgi:hypothetical protein